MTEKPTARTLFASKAMELSDMFAIKFAATAFEGSPKRMVKLKPPAESTGGGVQAREAIILVPAGSDDYVGLMCGWANAAEKRAELRAFDTISAQYQAKNKAPLSMNEASYKAFLAEAHSFFQQEGYVVELVREVSSGFPAAPGAAPTSSKAPLIALAVLALALGLGLGWFLFNS